MFAYINQNYKSWKRYKFKYDYYLPMYLYIDGSSVTGSCESAWDYFCWAPRAISKAVGCDGLGVMHKMLKRVYMT